MLYYYIIDYVNPKIGRCKDCLIVRTKKLNRRAYRECIDEFCESAYRRFTKNYSEDNIPNRKQRKQIIQETSIIISAISQEEFDEIPLELQSRWY